MYWQSDIEENLKFGLVDILIMKLLSEDKRYGYQLRQEIYEKSGGAIEIKEGSLYGPLYKMVDRGMITTEKIVVGTKRFRNYYRLTESGEEYLACALAQFNAIYGGANDILFGNNEKKPETTDLI